MILGQTLDINGNIIQKAKFEPLATDPSAGSYIGSLSGAIYFNTTSGVNRIHNGTEWVNIAKIQGTGSNITVTYSGNPLVATINLATTGTAGTYTKVTTDSFGRVTAGTTLIASDLPSGIDATKIADGSVTSTEFQYINSLSANAQNQLTTLSATKADKTITITAGTGLTGGGDLSTNRTISMPSVGIVGTYTKVSTDAQGRVSAATNITSADIPTLPATKIGTGIISDAEFNYLDGTTSNIQDQINARATTASLTAYQTRSEKGVANGYASLDSNAKVPTSQLPEEILGNMAYKGTWNATTNSPSITTASSANKGWYYIVTVSGTSIPSGLNPTTSASIMAGTNKWNIGDWIVSDGTYWDKIDNTDQVMSVFGRMGAVVAESGDYTASQITNTAAGNLTATNVQSALNELDTEKVPKTTTITAGTGLTGGGDLSTDRTLSLATTGTAGTYTKVTTNAYGQVTSGTTLLASDLPSGIDATKIGNGTVSNTEFQYLDGTSANIQTQLTTLSASRVFVANGADNRIATFANSNTLNGESGLTFDGNELSLTTINSTRLNLNTVSGTNVGLRFLDNGLTRWFVGTQDNTWNYMVYDYTTGNSDILITSGSNGQVTLGSTTKNLNLPSLSTSAVVVTDGSKKLVSSPITTTELGYLDGTTSNIQTQINSVKSVTDNAVVKNPSGAQTINVDSNRYLALSATDASNIAFLLRTSAANATFTLDNDGAMEWGAGGTRDTTLYRAGADVLKTDDSFIATGNVSASNFYDTNATGDKVIVSGPDKSFAESTITTTELGYLDNATSNIQTQINNITNGTSTRYSTTINIASGVQSFTITHNLGYLRPNVTVIDEVSDREIMVTPIYTSTSQLSLPITSSQAFTGARVEVYI